MGVGEGANRWWDKSLMWIVFKNGEAGFVGEHSCMDGEFGSLQVVKVGNRNVSMEIAKSDSFLLTF